MMRGLFAAALIAVGIVASAQAPAPDRARLVGLDTTEVEKRIGPPSEKEELADSNEAYWIYRTKAGRLSVHFQNFLVIDIDPPDFPVETILK